MKRRLLASAAILAALAAGPSAAQQPDPNWPCVQPEQPHLSPAAVWAGPPLDESRGAWQDDPEISRLVPVLAIRRTGMDEAQRLIDEFADGPGDDRDRRLTLLFSGVFHKIDRERSEIISGIRRYAEKQIELSQAIDETRNDLDELEAVENPSFDQQDKLEEIQDKLAWQTRIFQERAHSLTYVCESPVLLEKRAFQLGRAIAGHLE